MTTSSRLVCLLLLVAWAAAPLAAAPGALAATGPFGVMDFGVGEMVYAAKNPQRLLVRTHGDLFLSRDGGASWRSVLANTPQIRPGQLVTDAVDPDRWYVVDAYVKNAQIWKTADAGVTWSALPLPLSLQQADEYRQMYLVADDRESPALAVEIYSSELQEYRRFVSRDRGASWTPLDHPSWSKYVPWLLGHRAGLIFSRSNRYELAAETFADHPTSHLEGAERLVFDPAQPDIFFVIHQNGAIFKTADLGVTFHQIQYVPEGLRFFVQSAANPSHLALGEVGVGLQLSLDRGETWIVQPDEARAYDAVFDPTSGELLLARQELRRRRLDGSLAPPSPLVGLDASLISAVAARGDQALAVGLWGRTFWRGERGVWEERGLAGVPGNQAQLCLGLGAIDARLSPTDPARAVVACEAGGAFTTADRGATWVRSPSSPPDYVSGYFQLAASGQILYYLHGSGTFHSPDFGLSWEFIGGGAATSIAAHPDPARGLIAIQSDGGVQRYLPGAGWQPLGAPPAGVLSSNFGAYLFHDPAHPELVYAIRRSALSRSLDFGVTWELVTEMDDALPEPYSWQHAFVLQLRLALDPFDPQHFLLPGLGFETTDGGHSFFLSESAALRRGVFDPLTPGHFLGANHFVNGTANLAHGVFETRTDLPACTASDQAWCAGEGRYLLTVDWKTPQGQKGKATRVLTGSEDSGLFYFFDPNNWELLVKVLDGCTINQRQWVFAAGTTDVEYRLRVEDRWTGQIRHYFNPAGQAAAAITDSDAFAGCAATAPPGAASVAGRTSAGAAGEPSLLLANGRFEARARWTDFAGDQGDALTAPLQSDNSGLFYFFSFDNWEMLVKVLDGCAINGHWVLAAATTDAGYELTVRDTTGTGGPKTYHNPVGRASPAQIDLEAFACP